MSELQDKLALAANAHDSWPGTDDSIDLAEDAARAAVEALRVALKDRIRELGGKALHGADIDDVAVRLFAEIGRPA